MPIVHVYTYLQKYPLLKADRPHLHDYLQKPTDTQTITLDWSWCLLLKRFSCERADRWTDRRTDGWMLPSALSPCFAKLIGR